jgi:membrane-associated HD superfamily phosphohydrolase
MSKVFSPICFSFLLVMLFAVSAFSQSDAATSNGRPQQKEDLPSNIKETLAKQRIAREKKDYEELLKRSEEAVKLSEELEKSFANSNQISSEDQKKLDRLEKLVKKIRNELGADDDGEQEIKDGNDKENKPSTMVNAFKTLQSNASQLFDEIKKSTRYSVSVMAIQTSNLLLKLVKFIRFGR